jgi:hypothetical protein
MLEKKLACRQLKRRQRGESQPDLLNDQKSLSSFFRLRALFAHIKRRRVEFHAPRSKRLWENHNENVLRLHIAHLFHLCIEGGDMEGSKLEKAPLKASALFQQFSLHQIVLLQLVSNYEDQNKNTEAYERIAAECEFFARVQLALKRCIL